MRSGVDLVESEKALSSADRGRVGWRAPDVHVTQNLAGANVVPIADLRRIALKYSTISTDVTVCARPHVIRQGAACCSKTVEIATGPTGVLIDAVLEYGQRALEDVIAARYP